ncbi:MAG: four helix bundle protein [Saprospiraceae bacterium]|jgi:four helix bundle protein
MRSEKEKITWIEQLKLRIKSWVVRVLNFCETLPQSAVTRNIVFQLSKSSTSTGANHRAACRARSDNEFYAKISIAVEEADESLYWLEIIEAKKTPCSKSELSLLIKEADEITRILSTARHNAKK